MADIGEKHRRTGKMLEYLHSEGAVHIAFGSGDCRFLRSVPVIRVVKQGFRDIHCAVTVGKVAVRLYAYEIEPAVGYYITQTYV